MRLSEDSANRQAQTVARQLADGSLQLLDASGKELMRLAFAGFDAPAGGQVAARPFSGIAKRTGRPVRFRAFDASGAEELSGSVGPRAADLIYAPGLIVENGEVMIDTFVYRLHGK
jgi:hypothetical protein